MCHKNSINKGGHSNIHGNNAFTTRDKTGVSPFSTITSTSPTDSTNKWVINTSSKPLTKAQEKLLVHRPNFAMVPRSPPVTEYVAAIEQASSKLHQGEAEELRGEVKTIIKKTYNPPPNITKEERKAITELKKDPTRMILTAEKGVSLVVMDTEEYKKKAEELLQQPTYQEIPTDPTSKYKNRIINMLKSIKAEGGISEAVYKRLYPTGAGSAKFYGLPKIHK